tara:strand:+ start:1614 stop:1784 length:171 start_codon:yes stop_codon:yes gene_type:complete
MKTRLKKLIEMFKRARTEKSKSRLRAEINREIMSGSGLRGTELGHKTSQGRMNPKI